MVADHEDADRAVLARAEQVGAQVLVVTKGDTLARHEGERAI